MQVWMHSGQVLEDFDARGNDGRLQLRGGALLQPCGIGEKSRHAADRRGQTSIGVNLDAKTLGFSGHGC